MFGKRAIKGMGVILWIVALVHLWSSESFSSAIHVVIPGEVRVKGDKVTLGQIARIQGDDTNMIQRLRAIVIADVPDPGQSLTLVGEEMMRIIKGYPDISREIRWEMPEKIVIMSDQDLVSKEDIIQWITQAVLLKIQWPKERVKVHFISQVRDVMLPRGKITHEIIFPRQGMSQRIVPIEIAFRVDGEICRRVWVNTRIDLHQSVVVAARPMPRGKIIEADDVRMEMKPMRDSQHPMLADINQAVGKRTKKAIYFSQPITSDSVEAPPIVAPGTIVRLVVENGLFQVSTIGQVREKAAAGELVRVINLNSQKNVYGRVIDARTVQVEF